MIETGEYISRDAIYAEIERDIETYWTAAGGGYYLAEDALPEIENFPAADVAPIRRGQWVSDGRKYSKFHCCSVCESLSFRQEDSWGEEYAEELTPYCPYCGARMDLD